LIDVIEVDDHRVRVKGLEDLLEKAVRASERAAQTEQAVHRAPASRWQPSRARVRRSRTPRGRADPRAR
jgi:hypothetical protein